MDPIVANIITITFLLALILLGVHVGVALCVASIAGIWFSLGDINLGLNILHTTSFQAIREYVFGVIPLFVLMGLFANISGVSQEIYDSFNVFLRRVRGGLGIATVGANAIFATITGVSVASAAVFSKVALEPMTKHKYSKKFALGTIAGSSVLGMLIPPSLLLIIYGMLAEVSIGKLFMAGIIPGIVLALVYSVGIYLMALAKPELVGHQKPDKSKWTKRDVKILFKPWGLVLLMVLILGGMYAGFFTPTEAGAVGAFGAFLLAFAKKQITKSSLWNTLIETGYTSASVLFLLIAAQMYSRMLAMSGILNSLQNFINNLSLSPYLVLIVFIIILIILGMVLDSTSILLITMPLMLPVVTAFGFDLIWFGIISVIVIEMGLLTPPFGMVVYSMKSALGDKASIEDIFRGSFPFLVMMVVALVIIIMFPSLSLWLPNLGG
ncbi:TRAP transporter large permease [Bacillus sp. JJ1533]|uniref:TRAP transporter large permease n=1 Tax=Bacillus sp. JJ1533 TaxID=3122959 RepID=UPI002FFE643D